MAKKARLGMSAGSAVMLLLTMLVMLGCVFFVSMLLGDDLYARTEDFLTMLVQDGAFDTPAAQSTAAAMPRSAATPEPQMPAPKRMMVGTEPTPGPTPLPAPVTITLAASGTVYAPKVVRESVQVGGQYNFQPVFDGLGSALSDADLAIVTLETGTAGQDREFDNANTAPELLDALRGCGVDLLALATERALDKGYEGLELTIQSITSRGLAYAGVNTEGGRCSATMMSVDGVQVAVLSYTYGLSDEGYNKTGGDRRSVVAMMDAQRMTEDIRQARAEGANVVVVLPHWGKKNIGDTPASVRQLAVQLAEAGADVILGTHPNVPQGMERLTVKRSDGLDHEAVVCYSLGSLLTDSRMAENTAGMVAQVSVTYDPATRRVTLGELRCTPVYIARQREENKFVYRVVDAERTDALEGLSEEERLAAKEAAEIIRRTMDAQEGQE